MGLLDFQWSGREKDGSRMGSPDWQSPPALGNDSPSLLFPKFLQPHACLRGPEASQASFYIYHRYLKSHTWEDPVPPRQNLQPFVVSGLPKTHFLTRLPSQLKFLPHGPNTFFWLPPPKLSSSRSSCPLSVQEPPSLTHNTLHAWNLSHLASNAADD